MRRLAMIALAACVLGTATDARAEIEYPWCMMQGKDTPQSCSFTTREQCKASLSGAAGYCDNNPRYSAPRPAPQRRR
jgi:hypothetical protein